MTVVPHDINAERSLIAALLLSSEPEVFDLVGAEHFYAPLRGTIFAAVEEMIANGERPDATLIVDRCREHGSSTVAAEVSECMAVLPSARASHFAEVIVRCAVGRRVLALAASTKVDIESGLDPWEVLDRALATAADIEVPIGVMPRNLHTVDDFLGRAIENPARWVIPGLLREGWRAMLVATEGVGKSVIARQIALAASQGIHPFALTPIRPIHALIVDCENPDDAVADGLSMVTDPLRLKRSEDYEEGRAWIWHEQQGINLRARRWRNQFESILREIRPEVVCIGPLYKTYRVERNESDEQAAGEVQAALDDLRTRYRFALFIEHHAPKNTGGRREMSPYGSSLWLRWPEFGLSLEPLPDGTKDVDFRLARFRGNRVAAAWPERLSKGGGRSGFPWVAWWPDDKWQAQSSHPQAGHGDLLGDRAGPF